MRIRALTSRAALAGVLWIALFPVAARARPSEEPFQILPESFSIVPLDARAAAHEDFTTSFDFAHGQAANGNAETHNDVRTIVVNLPAGLVGSSTAVPTCNPAQLATARVVGTNDLPDCPIASQVGLISFELANPYLGKTNPAHFVVPLYNMEVTSFGVAAELGFKAITITQTLDVYVRPGDSGLTVTTPNVFKSEPHNISVTIWGVPAAREHDAQRGEVCGIVGEPAPLSCVNEFGGPQPANVPAKPFLANPTGCEPHVATLEADSWEHSEEWSVASTELPLGVECDRVPFDPSIEVQPSTRSAESPTGLSVTLSVPQTWENPDSLATANLKDVSVTLPAGMTVNPSAGAGLAACAPAQYEAETSASPPGAGCPTESKLGSIEVETPILAEKLLGSIYLAKPYDNPFNSLLSLYIVVKDPVRGVLIKVAGKIEPDPITGQLTTTFLNNPQQPFSRFTLKFRPGATAPLVSPPTCGAYSTQAALSSWSMPLEPRLVASPPFTVSSGVREGSCPSGGVPPFKPEAVAGTLNNAGGSYSPFYLRIERKDGEQEITGFSTEMPPGLTGNLTGIPFCSEAEIADARQQTGAQAEAEPACPAASQIGHTIAEAGVGTVLAQTPGRLYLAGPFEGAPFSVVDITSAKVGPFDLGTVVVHLPLKVDPVTAQVSIPAGPADQIPHIIKGIVIHLRTIRVYIDRERFILNPTSCEPMSISASVIGSGANFASSADDVPVPVSDRFQAADCSSLAFKPAFGAEASGKTSKANGTSLRTTLDFSKGSLGSSANIRSVKVELPRQLPVRSSTLPKACIVKQFDANPASCPAASIVGRAKAVTPILPVPLEGPAYFVSHGGAQFPELVMVLQGYGVTIDLHGETYIGKDNVISTTFHAVPDDPVESFELTLPEGPYSALTNNGSLCNVTKTVKVTKKVRIKVHGHTRTVTRKASRSVPGQLLMPTTITAQNGAVMQQDTVIAVSGCPKHKQAGRGARRGLIKR